MVGPTITSLVTRMRQTLRGRNAVFHVFELWVGLAGMISGIVFFYQPASLDHSSLSQVVGRNFAVGWVLGYMVSGATIWFGLLRPSPRWETVGLWLLGGATAANGIAIAYVYGWRGIPTAATLVALTLASWLRALVVYVDTIRLSDEEHAHGASSR